LRWDARHPDISYLGGGRNFVPDITYPPQEIFRKAVIITQT
jgi:hypothetical protein